MCLIYSSKITDKSSAPRMASDLQAHGNLYPIKSDHPRNYSVFGRCHRTVHNGKQRDSRVSRMSSHPTSVHERAERFMRYPSKETSFLINEANLFAYTTGILAVTT